jgi:plasmid maintenance system antidote protein VapI
MALRLEAWLKTPEGGGPSAEMFLRMQSNYDLWQTRHTASQSTRLMVRPAVASA